MIIWYYINSDNPKEKVIAEDSYAQLNTKLTIEKIEELKFSRKNLYKLSKTKLDDLLSTYESYQNTHSIDEQRIVYMTKEEILNMNNELVNLIEV